MRRGVFWRDMGVVNLRSGQPTMALTGGAAAPGRTHAGRPPAVIHLTLTDDHPYAQAFVIIEAVPRRFRSGRAFAGAALAQAPPWRLAHPGPAPLGPQEPHPMSKDASARAKAEKKRGAAGETVEIVKTVVYALLIALVLRVLLFQPYTIPSASEEPNLYQGDYIIVSKWSYGYSRHSILFSPPLFKGRIFFHPPKRGDIIVFKLPRDGHTDYIKRLIGLPGDRIQMKARRPALHQRQGGAAQPAASAGHRPRPRLSRAGDPLVQGDQSGGTQIHHPGPRTR